MSLAKFFKLKGAELDQVQDNLVRTLNPVFDTAILGGVQLSEVRLVSGSNKISHKLGRKLQGYIITRQRGAANIYDTQDANLTPNLTLTLTSDANVTVDIYVY